MRKTFPDRSLRKKPSAWLVSLLIVAGCVAAVWLGQTLIRTVLGETFSRPLLTKIDTIVRDGLETLTPLGLYQNARQRLNKSRYDRDVGWRFLFNRTEAERAKLVVNITGADPEEITSTGGGLLDFALPNDVKGPPQSLQEMLLGLPDAILASFGAIGERGMGAVFQLLLALSLAFIFFERLPLVSLLLLPFVASLIAWVTLLFGDFLSFLTEGILLLPYATVTLIAVLHRVLNNTIEERISAFLRNHLFTKKRSRA